MANDAVARLPAHEAIPALLDRHGDRIFGLGLRMCDGPDEAEDLVQETFLRAFRHWDQFEGRSDPGTWLWAIAARTCQRLHRRRAGQPKRMASLDELLPTPRDALPALTASGDLPLDAQLRRETREAVERAIGTLPAAFRIPLVLKELADFSLAEIAAILEVREGTVKTRVHRGRLLLRKALAARLPAGETGPPDHARQVCLDLLKTKQDALDRGAAFPLPERELCDRCRSMFATLDLAQDVCRQLRAGSRLPGEVRALVLARVGGDGERGHAAVSPRE